MCNARGAVGHEATRATGREQRPGTAREQRPGTAANSTEEAERTRATAPEQRPHRSSDRHQRPARGAVACGAAAYEFGAAAALVSAVKGCMR